MHYAELFLLLRVWFFIKFKSLTERLNGLTERLNGLTERLNGVTERLNGLTERLNKTTTQLNQFRPNCFSFSVDVSVAGK